MTKLLEDQQADLSLILRHFEIDAGRFRKALSDSLEIYKTGNAAKPVFSPLLLEWMQEAWLTASVDLDEARIRSGALLLSFLNHPHQFANGGYVDLLGEISRDALMSGFWDMVKGSSEKTIRTTEEEGVAAAPGEATALKRFCTDFTEKAAAGEIDPVFGRDREIRQMVDILARRRKKQSHRCWRGRCWKDSGGGGLGLTSGGG